jgi:UDP-GlcNAc:undecaprenyl-phosphate GlcNAc-1-phosphate transferase
MFIGYFLEVLIAFALGIVFLVLLRKFALRYNLLIRKGIPLVGGMSIGLSFIITCLVISFFQRNLSQESIGIIISSFIMLILGVIDDLHELSISAKFFVQIIATFLLILFGIRAYIVYIGNIPNIIITFIWVIGISNAFNLLDIMDGLAAGVAIIVTLSFAVISFLNGDNNTLFLTLALLGALFSFLRYNFPPAKIYMGNSGSHFLGFSLAAVALIIRYASLETKIALVSPLLILGFPIFDTAFLILIRLRKKRLPFKKSNDHLALRLLSLGYSKRKVLLIMLSLGLFFSACGVVTSQVCNPLDIIIIGLVVLVTLVLAKRMSKIAVYD